MDIKQSFEVVVQALEAANSGQKFTLKDSATIFAALGVVSNFIDANSGKYEPSKEEVKELKTKK